MGQANLVQLQERAEEVLRQGDAETAVSLTATIIAQDPNFSPAHFVQAVALNIQGNHERAAEAAMRAYRTAQSDRQRMQAAILVSEARFAAGQYSRAELWLRRAANNAKTEDDIRTIQQNFDSIRRANPLTVWLNFGLTPSNNVNNGISGDELVFRDQSGDIVCFPFIGCSQELGAQARILSGIEYFGSADLQYRLSESAQYLTTFDARLFVRTYTLSSESRDLIEELGGGLDGGDFSLGILEAGITHRMRPPGGNGTVTISAHTGKLWSGWEPYWYYDRFAVGRTFQIDDRKEFEVNASVEFRDPIDASQLPTRIDTITASHTWIRPNNDQARFSIQNQDFVAGNNVLSFEDHSLALDYRFAEEILGTQLSINTRLGQRHYDVFTTTLNGRLDHYATLGISTIFSRVSYFGFSPSMSIAATRRLSDLPEYTTTTWDGGFGIQSNF